MKIGSTLFIYIIILRMFPNNYQYFKISFYNVVKL